MAVLFLERIDKRCNERDLAAESGNLMYWFRCLRTIYTNIKFKLSTKEIEDIDILFIKAKNYLSNEDKNAKANQYNISQAEDQLYELDSQINGLMFIHNLIFPQSRKSIEEEIEDDF